MNLDFLSIIGLVVVLSNASCGPGNSALDLTAVSESDFEDIVVASRSDSCKSFIASLPSDSEKGFVNVPEAWDAKKSARLNVFWYTNYKFGSRQGTPIVFFNGGPAESSHSAFGEFSTNPLPIVFIDQRGTGCSDSYPASVQTSSDDLVEMIASYGSTAIVRDAEFVRTTVFGQNSKWIAYGQSYGGHIVHRYIQVAPKNLLSAFSHGYGLTNRDLGYTEARVLSQKRVGEEYLAKYPEDRMTLAKVRQQISKDDCHSQGPLSVCGDAILDAFATRIGFVWAWPQVHYLLSNLLDPDGTVRSGVWEQMANQVLGSAVGNESVAIAKPILSLKDLFAVGTFDPNDRWGCESVMKRLELQGFHRNDWVFNECSFLSSAEYSGIISTKDTFHTGIDEMTLVSIKESLLSHKQLKFYLYSGRLDTLGPVESYQDEVDYLGELVQYKNFEHSGHEGYFTEASIWYELRNESLLEISND